MIVLKNNCDLNMGPRKYIFWVLCLSIKMETLAHMVGVQTTQKPQILPQEGTVKICRPTEWANPSIGNHQKHD